MFISMGYGGRQVPVNFYGGQAAQVYGKLAGAYEQESYGAYNGAVARNKQTHMYNKSGEKEPAVNTCKHLIARGGDKRARAVIKDTEKLLERLER